MPPVCPRRIVLMSRKELTAPKVAKAKPPERGRLELWDTKATGLCLRIMSSGARSWSVRYRFGAKHYRLKLGDYPAVSLRKARDQAREALRLVSQGVNPVVEREKTIREQERTRASTFEKLIVEYEKYAKAKSYYSKALKRAEKSADKCNASVGMADAYIGMKRYARAKQRIDEMLAAGEVAEGIRARADSLLAAVAERN